MQPATLHVAPLSPPPPPPPPGLLWPKLKIAPLLIPLWIFQLLRACRPAPCPNLLESWKKLWSRRRRRLRLFIINPSPRSKEGRKLFSQDAQTNQACKSNASISRRFFKPYFYVWIFDWGWDSNQLCAAIWFDWGMYFSGDMICISLIIQYVFFWFIKPYFYVLRTLDWGMQTNYARQFGLIEGCNLPWFYLPELGLKNLNYNYNYYNYNS